MERRSIEWKWHGENWDGSTSGIFYFVGFEKMPGLNQAQFEVAARAGEKACPISNVLRNSVEITVSAKLE